MVDVPDDAGPGWNSPADLVSPPASRSALQQVHTQWNFVHDSAWLQTSRWSVHSGEKYSPAPADTADCPVRDPHTDTAIHRLQNNAKYHCDSHAPAGPWRVECHLPTRKAIL